MLITMDGNSSLKRLRRSRSADENTTDGSDKSRVGERVDSRPPPGDYFISREDVNKWARQPIEQRGADLNVAAKVS